MHGKKVISASLIELADLALTEGLASWTKFRRDAFH